MKIPVKKLSKLFENLSRYDHSDINALRQLEGRVTTLSVDLQQKSEIRTKKETGFTSVASGTVTLLPLRAKMECAALYLFENVLSTHGMDLSWDRAIVGPENVAIDPLECVGHDDLAAVFSKHDRNLSLGENFVQIRKGYEEASAKGLVEPTSYQKGVDVAAAIVAQTAVVKSVDLERFLFHKKAAFGSFFMGFRARGLEF